MVKYGKDDDIFYGLSTAGFLPRRFIRILLAIASAGIFLCLLVIIVNSIEYGGFLIAVIEHGCWSVFGIMGLFCIPLFIVLFERVHKLFVERKWRLWLTDENFTEYSVKLYETTVHYNRLFKKTSCFAVIFRYNGKKIVKFSQHMNDLCDAYGKRKARILYAPKYDEVLLIRDKELFKHPV